MIKRAASPPSRWNHRARTIPEFAAQLARRTPQMTYPPLNGYHVEMDGTCGLGHRLHRNAQIYHSARAAGYTVGVIWFPWFELFDDSEHLFASDQSNRAAFQFGNEPTEMRTTSVSGTEPPIIKYPGLIIPQCLPFACGGCHDEWRWRKEVFAPASTDHFADFHLRLILQLRPPWVCRLDQFLSEHVGYRRLVAIHIRTGNGETGDFVQKRRTLNVPEIMEAFQQELERYRHEEIAVLVASDSSEPAAFLKGRRARDVVVFTESLPRSGFVTGDWVSPNSPKDVAFANRELHIERTFEAYADLLLLGVADDLYAAAWSSFLAGPCLMNRRRADLGTTLRIYDANAGGWRAV
ncbi:MAG TPA: hypothetical protein VMY37_22645 [Thermoguttaceae bacterium]|nr:hypothetical protein [Thermoguttaceae bacterium]